MKTQNHNLLGIGSLALALFILSLQDVAIKWLSGDYPVMEIVVFRSIIATPCTLLLFYLEGGRGLPVTRQHRLEYLRGLCLFLSFTAYMMGVAAMPLAEVAAIRNSTPLVITLLSIIGLGEKVGPRRWLALAAGFVGVLLIVRPGSDAFNLGSLFILVSTFFYSLSAMITRRLGPVDSGATMSYFSSLVYLAAAFTLGPLSLMVGKVPAVHPSIAFLFHPWALPSLRDWLIMSSLGLVWAGGMYFVARAYTLAEASLVAPFEYLALLIAGTWDFVIWQHVPDGTMLAGAGLTLASGLYLIYRERRERPGAAPAVPVHVVEVEE